MEPPIKDPPRKGQPHYKAHSSGPLSYSSSTPRKDNLSTEDKVADPRVSFIQRFHCTIITIHVDVKLLIIHNHRTRSSILSNRIVQVNMNNTQQDDITEASEVSINILDAGIVS